MSIDQEYKTIYDRETKGIDPDNASHEYAQKRNLTILEAI